MRRRPSVLGADLGASLDPRPAPRAVPSDPHGFPEPLYLDNHLVVVVKPAGVLSQADRTGDADLLTRAKDYLKARFDRPGDVFVGLVHRLDRPVSGVMVLARTSKAAARLSEQFRERVVSKRYVALVEGTLSGQGRRTDWLLKTDESVAIVRPGTRGAREASLAWEAVSAGEARRGPGARTLVAVTLETGRSHQIRVQLAAMGHPIVGDARHGARTPWRPGEIALHALGLAIEHPTQRVPLAFAAAPDGWPAAYAAPLAALVKQESAPSRPGAGAPSADFPPADAPRHDGADRA